VTRQEIIDLIHNEYDPAPAHYKLGDNWDDGSGRIADAVMQRIEQLEASLAEWKALAIQWAKDNDQSSPSPLQAPHNPGERLRNSDVAVGEGETRQENDDVFKGFRGNNEA
jgi:hypothetical protein